MSIEKPPLASSRNARSHSSLFPHHFYDDAFRSLAIELCVVDLLPRAEIQLNVRYSVWNFMPALQETAERPEIYPQITQISQIIQGRPPREICVNLRNLWIKGIPLCFPFF